MNCNRKPCFPLTSPFVVWPLALGGMIYLLFRPESILFVHILSHGLIWDFLGGIRSHISQPSSWIGEFMIFSLPMALWCFAWSFAHGLIAANQIEKWIFAALVFLVAIASELLQLSILPGTFDWNDLLAILLGCSAYCIVSLYYKTPCTT